MGRFLFIAIIGILYGTSGMAQTGGFPNYNLYSPPTYYKDVPVKGSPLLFDSGWAHANVIAANNKIIENDSLYFNFNKINQSLLLTKDYRKIYEVDKREFKSVTFFWHDSVYIFEHVYLINNKDFFEELVRDDHKYSLYKFINTLIKPVAWHTNGLVSTETAEGSNGMVTEGKLYDQFVDIPVYYILMPNKEYRVLNEINEKSITRAFKLKADSEKVASWISRNKNRAFGEDFLLKLILFLNQ